MPMAKSQDTTECTDSTSGVARAARYRYARVKCFHSSLVPRQPNDRVLYSFLRHGTVVASRAAAMSGIMPIRKNVADTVRYVEIAKTSHTSGERKFGHSSR